ncbi:MAG: hypothetical protein JO057_27830, partial [Chloroflexi bacterium]|nr:hypothetical protein [Chloroflexota bacterium]
VVVGVGVAVTGDGLAVVLMPGETAGAGLVTTAGLADVWAGTVVVAPEAPAVGDTCG